MLHLKNITKVTPKTAEQRALTEEFTVAWLYTEDGDNWYEVQKDFEDDTLKVAYETATGEVLWTGKDVTGLNPYLMSVIELEDTPDNRLIAAGSFWYYRSDTFVFDHALKARARCNALLKQAGDITADLTTDLTLGLISDEDKETLTAWRLYIRALKALDFSAVTDKASFDAIEWPTSPQTATEGTTA